MAGTTAQEKLEIIKMHKAHLKEQISNASQYLSKYYLNKHQKKLLIQKMIKREINNWSKMYRFVSKSAKGS